MKIAIMQPYTFPYIGYFQLIHSTDVFVSLDDVNFIKKGWINRNQILVNGKPSFFNIPVKKISQNRLISDHEIDFNSPWQKKLSQSISMAYSKAPEYNEAFPLIHDLIFQKEECVSKFNHNCLQGVCNYLGIQSKFRISSDIDKDPHLKGGHRIMNICKQLKATEYINLPGGRSLYDEKFFTSNNLSLKFVESEQNISYKQYKHEFVPNLSIIDVMMFNPVSKIQSMLDLCNKK
ncbi:WbqC family protein [Reichenbachiella sp.]